MLVQRPETDIQHKIVLLGDSRVGKTSLLNRQLHGYQPQNLNPTIGCHCNELTMTVDDKPVTLQVWDTAGQEMYRALVPVYLKGAHAAIVIFDITEIDSFNSLGHWYDLLRDTVSESTPVFLVANKTDLLKDITSNTNNSSPNNNSQVNDSASNDSNVGENRSSNSPIERSNFVDDESAKAFAISHSSKFFRASALTGEGVDEIFQAVAKEMARAAFTDANPRGLEPIPQSKKKCC
ncbi:GTP-binding protein YPT52 [Tritrichomonas foetus]|uniref:GTP-binding protein YPT52 n=1 Tax=Tritrichomonas foetus TaxID=1144522 RepID=A0A1J4K893_9EUKA|nr:GTP-binding protein YPT52 [Tritrichomonas foetus]|eukprot:OHT07623.1 GTP-binding protein YPT52 [Tritrichomonas foetus]